MKLFDIFGYSIEANKKKPEKEEGVVPNRDDRYYCLWKSDLCDPFYISTKHKIFYGPAKNQSLDFDVYFNGFKNSYCLIKSSKEEFDEKYKNNICDCELGAGNNIVQCDMPYSANEICSLLEGRYKDCKLEVIPNVYACHPSFTVAIEGMKPFYFHTRQNVYKKACLNCGKCLSEIKDIYDKFEEILMVNKICSK